MSEPMRISPLLDQLAMGDPFSSHGGVRCCPAMREGSDEKYIVKIISVPASRTQLDALLLAGVYPNAQAAQAYFRTQAEEIQKEAAALSDLSTIGGFLPFTASQYVPVDNDTGFDVYLLSPYGRTLEKQLRRSPMTHLEAVNLGLDLCAALAALRKKGYVYVSLKPANVFVTDKPDYRIGDIGLVSLESLAYTALPDRYRSSYTPPEIRDAMSSLNETVDIYALGLILYQVYNGGALPFRGAAPEEELPPPMYADYEMAEIILKACAPQPEKRWQNPMDMGQALVDYMQRNGANDVPIIPPPPPEPEAAEEPSAEEIPVESPAEEAPGEQAPESDEPSPKGDVDEGVDPETIALIRQLVGDETTPSDENVAELPDRLVTEDGTDFLDQVNDLIAHSAPGPAVAPEAIEIPMPEPIVPPDPEEPLPPDPEDPEAPPEKEEEEVDESVAEERRKEKARKHKRNVRICVTVVVLALLIGIAAGSIVLYNRFYLRPVDLTVSGTGSDLTVGVSADVNELLLTVHLSDPYGNQFQSPVSGGTARFTGLNPDTQYSGYVEIAGMHKLTGTTTFTFATQAQTSVVSFTAVAGAEDGSVILNFTVNGPEPDVWTIGYAAEGGEEQTETFTGHMLTLDTLTVGSTYTFRLISPEDLYLVGETTVSFTASAVIYAENLVITGALGDTLTVRWDAPEETNVGSWAVRCYNDGDYDQSFATQDTVAVFTGISPDSAYTVEVTAEGMTRPARTYVTAHPVTISAIQTDDTDPSRIVISWDYSGTTPDGGWLLLYTVDNSTQTQVLSSLESSVTLENPAPGSSYFCSIQTATSATVFGGTFTVDVPEGGSYAGYDVTTENLSIQMCRTPEEEDWSYSDIAEEDYTSSFTAGEKASVVLHLNKRYNVAYDTISILFVIRDQNGSLVSTEAQSETWYNMWLQGYCELNLAELPSEPGDYTLSIYFDRALAISQEFTIQAAN